MPENCVNSNKEQTNLYLNFSSKLNYEYLLLYHPLGCCHLDLNMLGNWKCFDLMKANGTSD